MKYCLLLFLTILFTFFTVAQTIPLQYGVGNTYTYAEKDGITESNLAFVGKDSKGRVYAQVFTGALYILGNNYYKKIAYPVDAPSVSLLCIREIEGEIFLFGNDYVYLLKADTIQSYIKLPAGLQGIDAAKPILYFSCVQNNIYKLYGFKNRQFYLIHSSAASTASSHNHAYDTSGNIYRIDYFVNQLNFYKILADNKIDFLFSVKQDDGFLPTFNMITIDDWYVATGTHLLHYNKDELTLKIPVTAPIGALNILPNCFLQQSLSGFSTIYTLGSKQKRLLTIPHTDKLTGAGFTDSIMQTAYFGTFTKPFRLFPYLKQHPRIFQQSKSAGIHAVTQDSKGRIWAGSYEGGISVIDSAGIKEYRETGINYLPNAVSIDKHTYFIADNIAYGLQQFSEQGNRKIIKNNITGYYQYVSTDKQRYYFGTNNTQCLFTEAASLQKGNPQWFAIDSSKGYKLLNTITITEDKLGRVWMSHSSKGWAIYYPNKKKAVSYLIGQKETDFGFRSSYTDSHGTVWMGSKQKGLLYFNNYSSSEVLPKDIHGIAHPLLVKGKSISQLTQWQKWLVIAADDKMMLMDLDAWYNEHKTIIRYLNPQETGFTAQLEQNTIITDKRDSSIWFATSNMLYQWNIKQWLLLPVYIVKPEIFLQTKKENINLVEKNQLQVEPTNNSLKLSVWFQSPDNMPRYMSVAFIKKGDSLQFDDPSLETNYSYNNLAPGNYELAIQICQSDGSVTIHKYFIKIEKFLWQQWWFWALLSGIVSAGLLYLYNLKQKKRVAEEKAKTAAAELQSFKSEQAKKIANLQLVTLSSQFRPHFILNALNTIGAQMDDKPEAESVLSRLGESVNLIFNHAQQQKILHQFNNEWKLVQNIIHIHRQMYLKQLVTILPDASITAACKNIHMPLGILQIPVENALLHGLSNRENGPWNLSIAISEKENHIVVHITDNGVGRKKSATLSNFTKHGTGTKNLSEIVTIINAANTEKISITYTDDIYSDAGNTYGTSVRIEIPKQLNYGN